MSLREEQLRSLANDTFDVAIIGGGINGAVSAAALSKRGVKVALIDANDFAGFTSQHSSNLVWGGIKYMESYDFRLVASLCKSRNELMRSFPSTIKEIRFFTSISRGFRHHPLSLLLGSWIYWLFGRGYTQKPRYLTTRKIAALEPVIDTTDCIGGMEYSDAYLFDNDARFVFSFIRSAIQSGAVATNYVASEGSIRTKDNEWHTLAKDQQSGARFTIKSKTLINASGAFVDKQNRLSSVLTDHRHVFSKGIHLIVPRLTDTKRVLTFFASDGRLFFAIPMANRTCIGTTDERVDEAITQVTDEDRDFVLSNINSRLALDKPLDKNDIISERCGVRPLVVDQSLSASADFLHMSRKHIVEVIEESCHLSIFGGKLTDCINVGDEICDKISAFGIDVAPPSGKWYGEPDISQKNLFLQKAKELNLHTRQAEDTDELFTDRLWRRYGKDAFKVLQIIESDPTSCEPIISGTGLTRCEAIYSRHHEMIENLEDYLRRRSKLELLFGRDKLKNHADLPTLSAALFGDKAEAQLQKYKQCDGNPIYS